MLIILCAFILISFFEVRSLFKKQEKKEAAIFIVLGALAASLGAFLLLNPDYTSFSKVLLNIFGVRK